MAKVKNPQEFFEVFKGGEEEPQAEGQPAPQPEAPSVPASQPIGAPQPSRLKYAEVTVTPGTIAVTFSHTGLVVAMAIAAGLLIVTFCLGIRYGRNSGSALEAPVAEGLAPSTATKSGEPSLDGVPALDMTPPKGLRPDKPSASAADGIPAPRKPEKMYKLQLISGIPKKAADKVAARLRVEWAKASEVEVFRSGKHYGVRVGSWESSSDLNAQRAKMYYSKKKEFKDCLLVPVKTR